VSGIAALGLATAAIVALLAYREHYHEWPGANLPTTYEHSGRDYKRVGEGTPIPYDPSLVRLDRFEPPLNPAHDVLGKVRICGNRANGACDTVVFLRDGKMMVGYSLSGGP
jgi:hypothetical protein